MRFEVYKDRLGEYRWRLKARNGEIVATSEGYTRKSSATESAQTVQYWASGAVIADLT